MPAVMDSGGVEKLNYARPFRGGTVPLKSVTHSACNTILIEFAYVYKLVAVLGAAVEPLFQDF